MTQAALERDIVFGEIAVRNRLLSARELAECLRVRQTRSAMTVLDLPRLCIQRGYLSATQVQTLIRASNFLIKHREDVEIARVLHLQGLVRGRQIRSCFEFQEEAYYKGALAIPRLLDILDELDILKRDKAESALALGQQAHDLSKEATEDSKSLGALLKPVSESEDSEGVLDFDPVLSLPELTTGAEEGLQGFSEGSNLVKEAAPEERGCFRVEDILDQLPEARPAPVPFHDFYREQSTAGPEQPAEVKTGQIPRAFYRFKVKGSLVEYEPSRWLPFFTSRPAHSPLIDVSLGGLQILSHYEFRIGDPVLLNIHLPFFRRSFHSRGEVRWFSNAPSSGSFHRVGVEFTRLTRRDAACLKRLANNPALCEHLKRRKRN
jgi:hypothetical protein